MAESSAGGLLAASLLAVPGASAYFLGGAVVYTRPARTLMMGISDGDMAGLRSSSEPYAMRLARIARLRYNASWGLAETGASGPAGNRYGDAPGHTCVVVSGAVERALTPRLAAMTVWPTCAPSPAQRWNCWGKRSQALAAERARVPRVAGNQVGLPGCNVTPRPPALQ